MTTKPEQDRGPDCSLCPRLVAYRHKNQEDQPLWHNAPVPSFGDPRAHLLIVGLAPGRTGGNRTGRIFTGDTAGRFLMEALLRVGLAQGCYSDDARDDLRLNGVMIANAVACAPPENKPLTVEENNCRPHLRAVIDGLSGLKTILTLGDVARRNTLKTLGLPLSAMPGGHGAELHTGAYRLINSYHCSRLNLNTGRLTEALFDAVLTRTIPGL